jgi:DNA-directed RNA polymerase, mitochondrial
MDTNDLLKDPQVLHAELQLASDKQDKLYDRAMTNVGFGATTGGLAITNQYLLKVTEAVTEALGSSKAQSHGFDFQIEHLLKKLPHEVTALCILQAGLHSVARERTQVETAISIGHAINDELWAADLVKADKKLADHIAKVVKETYGGLELRKTHAKKLAAKLGSFTLADWTEEMLTHAGTWAMNVLLQAMPDVFTLSEPEKVCNPLTGQFEECRQWMITDEGMEKARDAVAEAVAKSPVYQPRTEVPKAWDKFVMNVAEDDRTMDRAQLLRTSHKDIISATRHAISTGKAAPALKAINALQSVPFKINTWVMDVIQQCYDRGIRVDGLPYRKAFDVPKRISDAEFKAKSVEDRKLFAMTLKGLKKANGANGRDTVSFDQDMKVAARLAVVDQFHCPMNMDWRGRVYALTHFNFQREDRVRAMFLFANGEPIGEEGIRWLKVHVANSGAFEKIDKKPIEERVKWVDENIGLLTDYVSNPLSNTGWTAADAPFLFLASCRELVNAIAEGVSCVSHLPVSFDGSCSGLQHLAAATRAPEGAYVNLTNSAQPSDVYQLVADIAKKRIEADLNSEELYGKDERARPVKKLAALALAHKVDRKLCKRAVMTFAYSSKEFGMSEQLMEDTMEPLELKWLKREIEQHPFGEDKAEWRVSCRYLAHHIMASIKQVVKGPARAMDFMQVLAKVMAHESKPLRWTTPAGLPWINRYHENTTERVELWCYDKGVKVRSRVTVSTGYEAPIAKEKAASAVSPNAVHACDASHLLRTVAASADEGVIDIATVHDSFGCLPSRATRFNQIIREQFLKMYEDHDVLAELYASAMADLTPAGQERLQADLRKQGFNDGPPEKGTLDLTEILTATYAFA